MVTPPTWVLIRVIIGARAIAEYVRLVKDVKKIGKIEVLTHNSVDQNRKQKYSSGK